MNTSLLTPEEIAQLAHEANRAYCAAMGDTSHPAWAEIPPYQKESLLAGVEQIREHPETTPEESHEHWRAGMLEAGWSWGPKKDLDLKLHPCIMPYANLPHEQRVKDYLFGAVVRTALGFIAPAMDMPDPQQPLV